MERKMQTLQNYLKSKLRPGPLPAQLAECVDQGLTATRDLDKISALLASFAKTRTDYTLFCVVAMLTFYMHDCDEFVALMRVHRLDGEIPFLLELGKVFVEFPRVTNLSLSVSEFTKRQCEFFILFSMKKYAMYQKFWRMSFDEVASNGVANGR